AQRRFTKHGDAIGTLAALQTTVFDIAHLIGIPTPEHLVDEAIIVGRIVARVDALEPAPVLGKDLFEDVPGRRSCCSHHAASLRSVELCVVALFYHVQLTKSTPSSALTGYNP